MDCNGLPQTDTKIKVPDKWNFARTFAELCNTEKTCYGMTSYKFKFIEHY